MLQKSFLALIMILITASWAMAQDIDTDVPMGWAIVPGNGLVTTTGGGDGDVVTVTSYKELYSYLSSSQPLVIVVEGLVRGSGAYEITSNKTIIGKGSDAEIKGIGLDMNGASNIIIRNLKITGYAGTMDAIALRHTHHVWIDHCDVSNCLDGLIDITRESDFNTVSWTHLSNHDKTMLINSGTSHPEDRGKLNTTVHHNWWEGTIQRNPRVGYGKVHVFNCYYYGNSSYGIGLHSQCLVLAEKNYFDHVSNPIKQMYRMDPNDTHHGFCESVDNIFDGCSGSTDDEGISFPVDDYYLYDFVLDSENDVPIIVKSKAGPAAEYGELGLIPVPGNGAVKVSTDPTLQWTKGTIRSSAASYIVSFGTTNPPPQVTTVSEQSYNPGSLNQGTVYYWRVDQDTSGSIIQGKVWAFRTDGPTLVDEIDHTIPSEFKMFPVYPNPFNPQTKIQFSVPHPAKIRLSVFDVTGRLIKTLFNQEVTAGEHLVTWDATGLISGVYFIKLSSDNYFTISKCTLMK